MEIVYAKKPRVKKRRKTKKDLRIEQYYEIKALIRKADGLLWALINE